MKHEIAEIVEKYVTSGVIVKVANTDRYGSEQIEIRQECDNRLIWRAWDYESGFQQDLICNLEYYQKK